MKSIYTLILSLYLVQARLGTSFLEPEFADALLEVSPPVVVPPTEEMFDLCPNVFGDYCDLPIEDCEIGLYKDGEYKRDLSCDKYTGEKPGRVVLLPDKTKSFEIEDLPDELTEIGFRFTKFTPMPEEWPTIMTLNSDGGDLLELSSCLEDLDDWSGKKKDSEWIFCTVGTRGAKPSGLRIDFPEVEARTVVKFNVKFLRPIIGVPAWPELPTIKPHTVTCDDPLEGFCAWT